MHTEHIEAIRDERVVMHKHLHQRGSSREHITEPADEKAPIDKERCCCEEQPAVNEEVSPPHHAHQHSNMKIPVQNEGRKLLLALFFQLLKDGFVTQITQFLIGKNHDRDPRKRKEVQTRKIQI